MTAMTWAAILHLATIPACTVPGMVPEFWIAVVHVESRYDPLALHDNTASIAYYQATPDLAEAIATQLMAAGHSVGVGLSQLTAQSEAQFRGRFGLTIRQALDPCANMRGGARHYVAGALSIYNTGNSIAGIQNGYAKNVLARVGQPTPVSASAPPHPPAIDPPINEVFARPVIKITQQ